MEKLLIIKFWWAMFVWAGWHGWPPRIWQMPQLPQQLLEPNHQILLKHMSSHLLLCSKLLEVNCWLYWPTLHSLLSFRGWACGHIKGAQGCQGKPKRGWSFLREAPGNLMMKPSAHRITQVYNSIYIYFTCALINCVYGHVTCLQQLYELYIC